MSARIVVRITCPECQGAFEAPLLADLDVDADPSVRDEVLSGRFGRVECALCGAAVLTEPRLVYRDTARRQHLAAFPETDLPAREALAVRAVSGFVGAVPAEERPDWTLRAVFGVPALREKLLLHDAGWDDRLVEAAKPALLRDVAPSWFDWRVQLHLDALPPEGPIFTLVSPPGPDRNEVLRQVQLAADWYEGLVARSEALEALAPEVFVGPVVDFRTLLGAPADRR